MNIIANNITNRLSLRPPQIDSLNILADLADKLSLNKDHDLKTELEMVQNAYPICSDFERNFPSICFALATGVGKTRLMGAFVTYLYFAKGIRNFFVLAPNLTIYNKLIEDFSNSTHPKYVFQGIGEFIHNHPVIITGDNYAHTNLFQSDVHINIFNISKINAETRSGKEPRIKRLSELLGESYFNYLSNLDDLALLMDESHHYRADRGMEVINELKPIIGLELTATPQVETSKGAIKFRNVVYEYSLSKAIKDGFVKEPAVATRKDFDPSKYSPEDLDRIKLQDGIRIHEDTKRVLILYAMDNKVKVVKPFVLVVAKDTDHAASLKELIMSQSFFEGNYIDKVMEIHSNQRGEEKDENIAQLVSLENPDNKIEIVIHVNMLKEGWDVTNLYTIIPLRTAASVTLREQTIGRGLRLPYGKRTGNKKVDTLTIVAHDRFQEIIDEANKPDSIIRKENIITIDEYQLRQPKDIVTSISPMEAKNDEEQIRIDTITSPIEKQKAQISLESKKALFSVIPQISNEIKNMSELKTEEIKEKIVNKIIIDAKNKPQQYMFIEEIIDEVRTIYLDIIDEFTGKIIVIPRITIQPSSEVKYGFKDFDLDTKDLNYQPISEEIFRKTLRQQDNAIDIISGKGGILTDKPVNIIINELINYSEIDYDSQSDLLIKLAAQALDKLMNNHNQDELINIVQSHKKEIGENIYIQLKKHFYLQPLSYGLPIVRPFTKIEELNLEKIRMDALCDYKDTIYPSNLIPSKVFCGFTKACHNLYKFDSKTEKDFAIILEQDYTVLKWLRPAKNQFSIYWGHNTQRYCPDFVVETIDTIYMVETKKERDIDDSEVQEKANAAKLFCKNATEFTTQNGGKQWKYILIPHDVVLSNMGFMSLAANYL